MKQLTGDGKTYEQEARDSAAMLGGVVLAAVAIVIVLGAKAIGLLPLGWPTTVGAAIALGTAALLVPALLPRPSTPA